MFTATSATINLVIEASHPLIQKAMSESGSLPTPRSASASTMAIMPPGPKAPPRKAPEDQRNYPDWRAAAGKDLKNRHDIEATAIAERIWTQFYVRGLNPKEASDRAEMVYRTTRLAAPPWPKKK
jgi:hypothetical protein